MSAFLVFVGLLGFIATLIILIINQIRRKPKKKISIALGVFFLVFLIGAFTLPSPPKVPESQEPLEVTAAIQSADTNQEKILETPEVPGDPPTVEASASDSDHIEKLLYDQTKGSIGSSDTISIEYVDRIITINVILENDPDSIISIDNLATMRASSITDEILNIENIDEYWDSITLVFDGIGKTTRTKEDINTNEYGGRFFKSDDFFADLSLGQ